MPHSIQPRTMESMELVDSPESVDELRVNGGVFSRLPRDYEFPRAGVYDLWIKWNIRDTVRRIPPLNSVDAKVI